MPDICRNVTALLNINVAFEGVQASTETFQPYIHDASQGSISGDVNIAVGTSNSGIGSDLTLEAGIMKFSEADGGNIHIQSGKSSTRTSGSF